MNRSQYAGLSAREYALLRLFLTWERRVARNRDLLVHLLSLIVVVGLTATIVSMVWFA